MTKQINKRWLSSLLATIATFIVMGVSSSAFAQKSWNDKLPKPDFSAMEEYYEIVEYEYDFTASIPTFNLIVKKKQAKTPKYWDIVWRDAKGVKIAESTILIRSVDLQKVEIGEPLEAQSHATWKRQIPQMKSVVITETLGN